MYGAIMKVKFADLFPRLATANLLNITQSSPFLEMSVRELIWGMEYSLLQVAKNQGTRSDDTYGVL